MNLDINVTSTCNLGCKYCSEGHNPDVPDLAKIENSKTDVKTQEIISFISKVLEKNKDEEIKISFWGGEPMMNMPYCLDLMTFYKDNKNVSFFFYTNGIYIKKYKESIKNINILLGKNSKSESRLVIQISYDGKAVNDIERLTKNDKSTSDDVKEAFKILGEISVERAIKSTITPRTFKYIYEAYLDVTSIDGCENYFPTPDTYNDYDVETLELYMQELKLGLAKIAKHIYVNKLRTDSFGWFRNSRALCGAGINYFSINLDGSLSPCHGTMYDEHSSHELGFISDENIISILDETTKEYDNLKNYMEDDCTNCSSLFCMKCPAGSFTLPSTKETVNFKLNDFIQNKNNLDEYQLKWTTKNINICKVFKLNDIIYKSLLKAKHEKPINTDKKICEIKR